MTRSRRRNPRHLLAPALLSAAMLTAHEAQAQRVATATAAPALSTAQVSTLYLKEGETIRGQVLENVAGKIRIRSLKSGNTFLVAASQVDSIVPDRVSPRAAASSPPPPPPVPVQQLPVTWPAGTVPTTAPPPTVTVTTTAPAAPVVDALDPPPPGTPAPAAVPTDTAATAPLDSIVRTTVAFTSGSEYYVGAGRLDGLVEGALLPVFHGDSIVATLQVKFLASHRASCEAVQGADHIAVGDSVRWQRPSISQFASAPPTTIARPRRLSGPGLHGRLGTRYLRATTTVKVDGQDVGSSGFNQPSLDARITGLALWGTPLGVAIDVRTRQTTSTSLGATNVDGHTRVYQADLSWNAPSSGFHAAAGRQYLATVSSVGLFDGALAEVNSAHVGGGAFAGFEPDVATLGFTTTVRDFGAYMTVHNRPGTATAVAFTIGAVGSYEATAARREWGIAQLSLNNRYLSLYLLQELDYFRPWKLEGPNAESSPFSGTSQFANLSVRATSWMAINATYDKRRNVPVIRDFTNPETIFDDSYREGYGAGVQLTGKRVYGGGDWRKSTGLTSGSAQSYTGTVGISRLTRLNVGLSARATWYQNDNLATPGDPLAIRTTGQLFAARLGIDPTVRIQLSLNAGLRQEHNPISPDVQRSTWFDIDADVNIARAWFASFSGLIQKDTANPGTSTLTQVYGGLTWRF